MADFEWGYIAGFDEYLDGIFYGRIGDHFVTLHRDQVDPDDDEKIQFGSVFKYYPETDKLKFPTILWTQEQLDAAEMRAEELWKYFNE